MKKTAGVILRFRVLIIVLTVLVTVGLGIFIPRISVNSDVLSYLPDDDSVAMLFDDVGVRFGGNQTAVIGIKSPDVFTYDELCKIRDITDSVKAIPGIKSALSLTNIIDISEVDSVLTVKQLIDPYEIPDDPAKLDSIRNYVLSKDFYKGFIVSEDCKLTMVAAKIDQEFTEPVDSSLKEEEILPFYWKLYPSDLYDLKYSNDTIHIIYNKAGVSQLLKSKLEKDFAGTELHFGGLSFMTSEISGIIVKDIIVLGPIALLMIMIALFLGFRNFRGVIMPVASVVIAIVWTIGLMMILGFQLSLITSAIPIILIAVGSAYTLHVTNKIQMSVKEGLSYSEAMKEALSYIIIPVLLAAVTTMIGFLSFIYGSYLVMIRDFGIMTAVGVLFSLLLALTFSPAVLSYFPVKKPSSGEIKSGVIDALLKVLFRLTTKHAAVVGIFWVVTVAVMLWGATRLERKVDLLDYFKSDHPSRVSEEVLRKSFGGTVPVYVQVKGNVQSPEVLKTMKSIEDFLKSQPIVTHVQSVASLIEEMNVIMGEGKVIPEDEAKIQNLWFLLDGQEVMDQLVTPTLDYGLVQGVLTTSDSRKMAQLVDSISVFLKTLPQSDQISVVQTGFPSIYKKLDESILNSQKQSMAIAIILVFIFVAVLLRSVGKGLLTVVPIIATLFILFGFLGWSGIPLDVATVLVASVSIGIGIDYAIHFVSMYSFEQKRNTSHLESLQNAFTGSGKSIVINIFSVTLGFLVLRFSDLVPLQRFGLSVAVTMVASGLAALTLMPVFIVMIQKLKHKSK